MALGTFGEFPIVFLTKVNLLYLLYSPDWWCGLLYLTRQNCLLKAFLKTNLNESGISLPVFPCGTNLKLNNISVTLKMVKNVTANLDLSKVSGPDCILVVAVKNCAPELS